MTPTTRGNIRHHAQTLIEALDEADHASQINRTGYYLLALLRDGVGAGLVLAWQVRQIMEAAECPPAPAISPEEIRSTKDLLAVERAWRDGF